MADKIFKILADVIIKDGDITISNMDPINFPSQPKQFNIAIEGVRLGDAKDSDKIITKIIGKYTIFIPNCYINTNNTIILFINNHWLLYLFYNADEFYYFTYTPPKDVKYMDIDDIKKLFDLDNIHFMKKGKKTDLKPLTITQLKDLFPRIKLST
jgi:hypothetical protein